MTDKRGPGEQKRFILRDSHIRSNAVEYVGSLPVSDDQPVQVVIGPYHKRRSLAQNSCFHAICRELSELYAEFYGHWHSPGVWKQLIKQELLGEESHEVDGRIVTLTVQTSSLSVKEFAWLLTRIPPWAWDCFELQISLPDEWPEAVGKDHGR